MSGRVAFVPTDSNASRLLWVIKLLTWADDDDDDDDDDSKDEEICR